MDALVAEAAGVLGTFGAEGGDAARQRAGEAAGKLGLGRLGPE